MNKINDRIIELRTALNLNQESFGEKISLVRSGISNMEKGIRNVSNRTIKLICQEYNVNESWLRTGKGTMFNENRLELAELMGEKIKSLNDFQINAIKEFMALTPEQAAFIRDFMKKLLKEERGE